MAVVFQAASNNSRKLLVVFYSGTDGLSPTKITRTRNTQIANFSLVLLEVGSIT